ncbi:hypothetical protein DFH09DRAFT_1097359 [Mycena vulgaris]|nr:hypothetical protein DFH09DRAFT_1097359 [Mycena vulgaris]
MRRASSPKAAKKVSATTQVHQSPPKPRTLTQISECREINSDSDSDDQGDVGDMESDGEARQEPMRAHFPWRIDRRREEWTALLASDCIKCGEQGCCGLHHSFSSASRSTPPTSDTKTKTRTPPTQRGASTGSTVLIGVVSLPLSMALPGATRDIIMQRFPDASVIEARTHSRLMELWCLECNEYHNHRAEDARLASRESSAPSSPSTLSASEQPESPPPSSPSSPEIRRDEGQARRRVAVTADTTETDTLLERKRERNRAAGTNYAAQEALLRRVEALANEVDALGQPARVANIFQQVPVTPMKEKRAVLAAAMRASSRSPSKSTRSTTPVPTPPASPSKGSRSVEAAAATPLASPTKNSTRKVGRGFAPPYRPGDDFGPTPLLPRINIKRDDVLDFKVEDEEHKTPALQSYSDSDERNAEDDRRFAAAESRAFSPFKSLCTHAGGVASKPLVYGVSGHSHLFQDRARAIAIFMESPGSDLFFTYDEAAVWAFIDKEAARMASLGAKKV